MCQTKIGVGRFSFFDNSTKALFVKKVWLTLFEDSFQILEFVFKSHILTSSEAFRHLVPLSVHCKIKSGNI